MAAVSTNDLKRGMSLNLPEGLFQVVDFQHVKPGKGGAFVRTTLRNTRTGGNVDRTFRADEKVEQAMRSEEHTSELQSLMRISYAVFCLKKKIHTNSQRTSTH